MMRAVKVIPVVVLLVAAGAAALLMKRAGEPGIPATGALGPAAGVMADEAGSAAIPMKRAGESGTAETGASGRVADVPRDIRVYKTESCGCCALWVDHLRAAGYAVTVENVPAAGLSEIKRRHGVPVQLSSCHTALAGGRVLEGHIPADVIRDFLESGSEAAGIAVPGMPIGSPGMEGPNPRPYDVVAFDSDGNFTVFRRVNPQ